MFSSSDTFADKAAFYVSLGWKIFPLLAGSRIPFKGSHGVRDATDDANTIDTWDRRDPNSNISVHPGKSGLVVVDIDNKPLPGKPNGFVLANQLAESGKIFPQTAHVRTRSGGLHLYYRVLKPFPSLHKKRLGPGIDLLTGDVGAILPPSTIDAARDADGLGGQYEWVIAPFRMTIPLLPKWVFDVTRPPPAPKYSGQKTAGDVGARFEGCLRRIEFADKGRGNSELNKQSHLVGRLVAQGSLPLEEAEKRLLEAAMRRGRPYREALATIRSGLRAGMKNQGGGI